MFSYLRTSINPQTVELNEGVEKHWTPWLLPFSLYLGYAFTPPKIYAWILARSMRSHFVGIAQNSQ